MRHFINSFAFICVWSSLAFSQDPNFHIYLAFGQSNMDGAGAIEEQDKLGVNARFKNMSSVNCSGRTIGQWLPGNPPLGRCSAGLSPIDYFGRTLVEKLPEHISVGVIVVAVAGSKIELFHPSYYQAYADSAPSWMQGWINEFNRNPYKRMVDLGKEAQKVGVIKGILLHQGESNNGEGDKWLPKVQTIYNNLISDLKLDASQVPLLAGELVSQAQNGKCWYHNQFIAKLPQYITNSHVISSSGLPHKGDSLHFSSESYRTFGKRYAEKMLSLLTVAPPIQQEPYKTRIPVPGLLEAENYDLGGEGVSFHDNTLVNSGNALRTDAVDITGDAQTGFKVGWTEVGEWLEYSVHIEEPQSYLWEAKVSSGGAGASFQLQIMDSNNFKAISDTILIPNTGSWDTYTTISGATTVLPAGDQTLRIFITGAYGNIDWLQFTRNIPTKTQLIKPSLIAPRSTNLFDLKGRQIPK